MRDSLAQLGWGIAASVIGSIFDTTFSQYRPGYAAELAGNGTLVNTELPGYVTANAYQKTPMPLDPSKPRAHLVFDPASLRPGDYLTGALETGGAIETFFVSTVQSPAPPCGVRCNAVVNVTRAPAAASGNAGFGVIAPMDTQIGGEQEILTGWPASVLREGRGQNGDVNLPDDVKLGGYLILLPPSIPTELRTGDVLTNTTAPENIRMVVAMAEQTHDYWKLLAQEATS